MARAEYLKEQVKVGAWGPTLGQSYVCAVAVCLWLSAPAPCTVSPSFLSPGLSIAVCPLCSADERVSLGSRDPGQRGAVGVCS